MAQRGWRTGSPDRLDQLLQTQKWDPVQMFGGRRAPQSAPAPAAAPPPASFATLSQAASAGASSSSFVAPEWCAAPHGAGLTAHLLVWRGAMLMETVQLGSRRFFVAGRLADVCNIVLEHASASRQHAAIVHHHSGSIYIIDLGSAHGTFLGDQRLAPREPTLWPEGTACTFGASTRKYVLRVQNAGPVVPPDQGPVLAPTERRMTTHRAETEPILVREAGAPRAVFKAAPSDGSDDDDGDDRWEDTCLSQNTWHNTCIPVEPPAECATYSSAASQLPSHLRRQPQLSTAEQRQQHQQHAMAEQQHRRFQERQRRLGALTSLYDERANLRTVRFASGPPRVRRYEPPSPERLVDPDPQGDGAPWPAATVPVTVGGARLPRPKCIVSVVSASSLTHCTQQLEEGIGATTMDQGHFAHLVSQATFDTPLASSYVGDSVNGGAAAPTCAGLALSNRPIAMLTEGTHALRGSAGATTAVDKAIGCLEGSAPKAFPKERWHGAGWSGSRFSTHAAGKDRMALTGQVECHTAHTTIGSLVAARGCLSVESVCGKALLAVHCAPDRLFAMSDGRHEVRWTHGEPTTVAQLGVAGAIKHGLLVSTSSRGDQFAASSPNTAVPIAAAAISIVNYTRHSILVYVALQDGQADSALTPWEGAQDADEQPVPLSCDDCRRGTNCLLLAPLEGTAECDADDAERAPFGESNTFRYVAASGKPIMPAIEQSRHTLPFRLRIEASFQIDEKDSPAVQNPLASLLGANYVEDKAIAEAPFCVITLPL